jgi:hypothetical protein
VFAYPRPFRAGRWPAGIRTALQAVLGSSLRNAGRGGILAWVSLTSEHDFDAHSRQLAAGAMMVWSRRCEAGPRRNITDTARLLRVWWRALVAHMTPPTQVFAGSE